MDIEKLVAELRPALPQQLLGLYLCGSAARGELTPHSDIDLLAVTERSLDQAQREALTAALLRISGWSGHGEQFPEAANRRPVEFSVFVLGDIDHGSYPPRADFQYGEWLRAEFLSGAVPQPFEDPDLLLLLEDARQNHRPLSSPDLQTFLASPPPGLLSRACRDALPALLKDLRTDTRNVLLTLARMAVTVSTGRIVAKDDAAAHLTPALSQAESALLLRAAEEYRGATVVDWEQQRATASSAAGLLESMIRIGSTGDNF